MAQTEIILKKDIMGLGDEGDIKKVAPGYARNFLLPFGYAVLKTKDNLEKLEAEQEAINKRKDEKLEASKSVVDKVQDIELLYEVNTSGGNKLFGSIGINELYQSIKEKGIEVDKNQIILPKPFKLCGDYEVDLKFYGDLKAKIKVTIKSLDEEEAAVEETPKEEAVAEEASEAAASTEETTSEESETVEEAAETK